MRAAKLTYSYVQDEWLLNQELFRLGTGLGELIQLCEVSTNSTLVSTLGKEVDASSTSVSPSGKEKRTVYLFAQVFLP